MHACRSTLEDPTACAAGLAASTALADGAARPRVRVVDLRRGGWVSVDELTSALRASMSAGEVDLDVVPAPSRLPPGGEDARAAWARRIAVAERADAVAWVEAGARGTFEATLWLLDATGSEPRLTSLRVAAESAFDAHRTFALALRSMLREALELPGEPGEPDAPVHHRTPVVVRDGPRTAPVRPPPLETSPLRVAMGPIARQNDTTVLGWRGSLGLRLPARLAVHGGVDLLREDDEGAALHRRRIPVWLGVSRRLLTGGGLGLSAEVRTALVVTSATVGNGTDETELSPLAWTAGGVVTLRITLGDEIALEVPVGVDARLLSTRDGGVAERSSPIVEGSLGAMLALGAE